MAKITIDGQEHDLEKMSDAAKAQIQSIQMVEGEMRHLQLQLSIAQTARNVHAQLLKQALEAGTKN